MSELVILLHSAPAQGLIATACKWWCPAVGAALRCEETKG